MNFIEKKQREKEEYLNRLQQAIETTCKNFSGVLSKFDSPNVTQEWKDYFAFLKDAYLPLATAIDYIFNYKKERLPIEEINKMALEIPDWNDVYTLLCSLPPEITSSIVAHTSSTNSTKEGIVDSILNDNKNQFLEYIKSAGNDINFIIKAYSYYQIHQSLNLLGEMGDNFFERNPLIDLGYMVGVPRNIHSDAIEKMNSKGIDGASDVILEQYINLIKIYLDNEEDLSLEERDIINNIVKAPNYIGLYEVIYNRFRSDKEGSEHKSIFEGLRIFNTPTNKNKAEYFNGLHPDIFKEGDDKFKKLVNYIANSGYIENSEEAKQLFTYRLTGRCRPQGELTKLLWNGREKMKADELIFIVRFATDNSKTKYNKMREFFEGPDFPKKNISGHADAASIEFRQTLKSMYPTVFRIKDVSSY